MICPECNGRGETTYYVETDRDENTVTVKAIKDICHTCNGSGKKPMTNADRIRAMSDEELAEFIILSPEMEFDVCLLCQFGNKTPMDDRGLCLSGYGACDAESRAEAFKEWLKQPVETENVDRCVCCGAIIPEGQIVCPNCLVTVKEG